MQLSAKWTVFKNFRLSWALMSGLPGEMGWIRKQNATHPDPETACYFVADQGVGLYRRWTGLRPRTARAHLGLGFPGVTRVPGTRECARSVTAVRKVAGRAKTQAAAGPRDKATLRGALGPHRLTQAARAVGR